MINHYKPCRLCPRSCNVDRTAGTIGYCKETAALRLAVAVLHYGEEPPLVGEGGSGTIFVSGCNLRCVFCQNYQISQGGRQGEAVRASLGKAVSAGGFAEICIKLQDKGAVNINIVTGSHAIPAITQGITAAKKAGVQLPFLWNCSAYETPEALELLREHIDIFLPDIKTLDSGIAANFFNAPDYPNAAAAAVLKMIDMAHQKSPENAHEKVIIRHLILPGYLEATRRVLQWFADNAKGRALLSLMTQYTPVDTMTGSMDKIPQRFLLAKEYKTVLGWLDELGIEDGFCQELVTGSDWLPDFNRANPFSSKLSVPVWHCS